MNGSAGALDRCFARARKEQRAAFIPYIMAGDPDLDTTERVLHALGESGADAIELGIPYGDPLADGPTIAAAGVRALAAGVGMRDVFSLVSRYLKAGGVPVVLFTYFNPVYQYGVERFAHDASDAGASAAIVPDIPLEESSDVSVTLAEHGMDMPLLVAPTTSRDRAALIAKQSTGFVYVVSRMGVTGVGTTIDIEPLRVQLAVLRDVTDKPLAIGFGVSTPEHARLVASLADAIIVGSATIESYSGYKNDEAAAKASNFARAIVGASARR